MTKPKKQPAKPDAWEDAQAAYFAINRLAKAHPEDKELSTLADRLQVVKEHFEVDAPPLTEPIKVKRNPINIKTEAF